MTRTPFAVGTLLAGLLALPAQAQQNIDLGIGPVDFTTWNLFGDATAENLTPGNGFTYSLLNLTHFNQGDEAGAAFEPTGLALDYNQGFRVDWVWSFPIGENMGLRGDGLTFTLTTTPGVGTGGSGLGYEGVHPSSLAFAIDTFHFDGDPVSPSLQILTGGNITPLVSVETGLGDDIRDPNFAWFGSVSYTPSGLDDNTGVFTGSIDHINLGSFSVQANVDFGALGLAGQTVYYGFTAGSGLATDGHTIQWAAPVPVPEPGSWALLMAGLGLIPLIKRRR